jgi:hypothetical protein
MQKVAIHSVPRSGSTWLGNIFSSHPNVKFSYQPLFSYAFKGYLTSRSSKIQINNFFEKIVYSDDHFINQNEDKSKGIVPIFQNKNTCTHSVYKEVRYHYILDNMLKRCEDVKVIFLIRNPLSVLKSWFDAPREFRSERGWVFEDEWFFAQKKNLSKAEEYNGYAKWKEVAQLFLKLNKVYPNQTCLISYSELLNEPTQTTKQLFDFVGLELTQQTLDFLKLSTTTHNDDAYSVFKKKNSDTNWNTLPKHIIDYITEDLKNTELEIYLNA